MTQAYLLFIPMLSYIVLFSVVLFYKNWHDKNIEDEMPELLKIC